MCSLEDQYKIQGHFKCGSSPDIFGKVNFYILNTHFPKLFHFKIEGVFVFWGKK